MIKIKLWQVFGGLPPQYKNNMIEEKKYLTLVEKRLEINKIKRKLAELNDNIYYTAKLQAFDKELDINFIKRVQRKNFEEKAKLEEELNKLRRK